MKVLTTEEASRNLSELVQSAIAGEKITIYDGARGFCFSRLLQQKTVKKSARLCGNCNHKPSLQQHKLMIFFVKSTPKGSHMEMATSDDPSRY